MHDGNYPDTIRFVHEDDCVRKVVAEMSARRWIKFPKAIRIYCDVLKKALHLAIETNSQLG